MNARAQRARQNKKRNKSFGVTSQREIKLQNGYSSSFTGKAALLRRVPLFDTRLRNRDDLETKCPQKIKVRARKTKQLTFWAHRDSTYGSLAIIVGKSKQQQF